MKVSNSVRPLVTIGIPTFNRADGFLKQAIKSAINQTYHNIEIVVSDNCSNDQTEMVVKGFSESRIRYYRQSENIGANNNFNFCVDKAQGDYFLLLHDDDLIDHDFVEACMNVVNNRTDIGVILTGNRIIDSEGNAIIENHNCADGLSTSDFITAWFNGTLPLFLCSTLYNTKKLREIGGFQSKTYLYQDVVATFRLAAKFGRVDMYDVKASFRKHTDNRGSEAKVSHWCEDSLYLLDSICNLLPEEKDALRSRGMSCLIQRNYRRASDIASPIERLNAYVTVYRKFDYQYSPVRFIYSRYFIRLKHFMKKKWNKL